MLHARLNGRTVGFRHNGRASVHNGRSGLHASQRPLSLLLSSSQLCIAPYTAIPIRGAVTPSFTRAGVKNLLDFEGREYQALSGEWCFWHVRRARNLVSTSNIAAWTTTSNISSSSGASDPDGGATAYTLTSTAPSGYWADALAAKLGLGQCRNSVWIRRRTGTGTIRMYTGANGFGVVDITGSITTDWTRITPGLAAVAALSANFIGWDIVTSGDAIDVWHPQSEDVTGQSVQTASEYVSVGVESAPAYHGSMVDGVKCFPTDYSGNPLPTSESATYPMRGHHVEGSAQNICLQSNAFTTAPWADFAGGATGSATQNAVGVAGAANTAWTLSDTDATKYYGKVQNITVSASTTYTQSLFFAKTSGATSFPYFELGKTAGTMVACGCIVNTNAGTLSYPVSAPAIAKISSYGPLFWRVEFSQPTGTTTTVVLAIYPAASSDGTSLSAAAIGSCVVEGCGLETGAFASSHINTTTVAVTRPADVPSHTGALCGQITTLATSFWRPDGVATAGAIASLSDGTANEYESIGLTSATAVQFTGVDGGVSQWATTASNAYTAGTQAKAAQAAATNSVLIDLNGIAQTPDTTATMPTYTTLQLGHLNGGSQINGAVGPYTYGWTPLLSQAALTAIDK